jgi:P27 family predicted phage terminase small subunit
MATRGRKPTPTHLKLVNGNPGKRAINKREAKPPLAEPTPPPHLSDDAKVEWGRVMAHLLRCGLMSEIDRAGLAAYCQAYGRWVQAERALDAAGKVDPMKTGGLLTTTTNGNIVQSALVGIANTALALMMKAAAEFGMTPSSRSRINVEPNDDQAQATGTDRFFRPKR